MRKLRGTLTVHRVPLAVVPSWVPVYEILEVVFWIFDGADFIVLIDEVARLVNETVLIYNETGGALIKSTL